MVELVALALVGVLCVLNLLLTFGVIRRLREHGDLIAKGGVAGEGGGPPSLSIGERTAEFTGTTTDGVPVSRDALTGDTLVAFLSPGCTPCERRLPAFVAVAGDWPGGRNETLAVIVSDQDAASAYIDALAPVAQVVVEPPGGEIATAFGVSGYPVFGVVDRSGTVLRSGMEPGELRVQTAGA